MLKAADAAGRNLISQTYEHLNYRALTARTHEWYIRQVRERTRFIQFVYSESSHAAATPRSRAASIARHALAPIITTATGAAVFVVAFYNYGLCYTLSSFVVVYTCRSFVRVHVGFCV